METIGLNALKIGQKEFNGLMKKAECDTGSDLETIGFNAEGRKHSITWEDTDGKLSYCFQMKVKGLWLEVEPTEEQKVMMSEMVVKRALEITAEAKTEAIDNEEPYHPYQYAI